MKHVRHFAVGSSSQKARDTAIGGLPSCPGTFSSTVAPWGCKRGKIQGFLISGDDLSTSGIILATHGNVLGIHALIDHRFKRRHKTWWFLLNSYMKNLKITIFATGFGTEPRTVNQTGINEPNGKKTICSRNRREPFKPRTETTWTVSINRKPKWNEPNFSTKNWQDSNLQKLLRTEPTTRMKQKPPAKKRTNIKRTPIPRKKWTKTNRFHPVSRKIIYKRGPCSSVPCNFIYQMAPTTLEIRSLPHAGLLFIVQWETKRLESKNKI